METRLNTIFFETQMIKKYLFQPMVNYIVTKENTGVYNTRRSVQMPVDSELQERCNER